MSDSLKVILIGLFVVSTFAQTKKTTPRVQKKTTPQCQISKAPPLRGFFLGQSVEEINQLIPNFKTTFQKEESETKDYGYFGSEFDVIPEANEIGLISLSSDYPFPLESGEPLRLPKTLEDVRVVWRFFNNRIFSFSVFYPDYEPPNSKDFVKQLVEKTDFPSSGWNITDEYYAVLKCQGFKIWINSGYREQPNIEIIDMATVAEIKRIRKETKQRKISEERERIRQEREKSRTLKP